MTTTEISFQIENSIYNLDNSVFDFETLEQIKKLQATEEELAMIKMHVQAAAEADNLTLDAPEQFLFDLARIGHFNERLECFMFQSKFYDNLESIEHRLNNISHVCDQMLNSHSMKQASTTSVS